MIWKASVSPIMFFADKNLDSYGVSKKVYGVIKIKR